MGDNNNQREKSKRVGDTQVSLISADGEWRAEAMNVKNREILRVIGSSNYDLADDYYGQLVAEYS